MGLSVSDMEAMRDRTPEAEGWGSRRAFQVGLRDGPGPMVERQGWDPCRPRIHGRCPRCNPFVECLLSAIGCRHSQCPSRARGGGRPADVRRPNDFAGPFPANSHERSAQTRIGLGRTLVRIGRRRAALRTALLSMAQGPLSPRAHSRPGLVAAAQKWHGKEAAQLGTPTQWSVPGSELKDGWWTGVRLRLSGRWGGKGWG